MSLQSNRAARAAGLAVGLIALALGAGTAQAHITMKNPKPWTSATSGQKGPPPCGLTMATKNPTTFKPGESIMVTWDETIKHPGRFRIAFAKEGTTFPNPMTANDMAATMPIFIDGIDAKTGTTAPTAHQRMITFPNEPCASCILQLIQVMKVNPPYNSAADQDVYYQCAAIVLAGAPVAGDGGAPMGGADGGAGMGGGGTGGSTPTGGTGGGGTPTGGMMGNTGGVMGNTGGMMGNTGGKTGTGGTKGDTGGAGGEEETGGTGGSRRAPSGGCAIGGNGSGGALLLLVAVAIILFRRRR
jgi:MYXO-CTERM domain-containing protein